MPDLLRSRAQANQEGRPTQDKSVIWLWLSGGPTHVEIRPVLVNLHTAVVGSRAVVPLEALAPTDGGPVEPTSKRSVWFEQGWLETPIYERRRVPAGSRLDGPAVIEQLDTTIVIEQQG